MNQQNVYKNCNGSILANKEKESVFLDDWEKLSSFIQHFTEHCVRNLVLDVLNITESP